MPPLPQRSKRFRVGKEIGGAVYVHRSYQHLLGPAVAKARQHIPPHFNYDVVKYVPATGLVSFVASPDFNTADEPTVGEIFIVRPDGSTRRRRPPADPEIYHHKWLFVADDYQGFDVQQSKQRSRAWTSLPGIDRRKIARRCYWQTQILPRLPPNS